MSASQVVRVYISEVMNLSTLSRLSLIFKAGLTRLKAMNTETSAALIRKAQEENDPTMAYDVFQTYIGPLTLTAENILRDNRDRCEEWVRDELLRVACRYLHTLRRPEAWKSFLQKTIANRARSLVRRSRPRIVGMEHPPELPTEQESIDFDFSSSEPASDAFLDSVSFRDRALLKLSYGIAPEPPEWKALAIRTGRAVTGIISYLEPHLLKIEEQRSKNAEKLTELSEKLRRLDLQVQRTSRELEHLAMCNPADENAVEKTTENLQQLQERRHRIRERYHRLQKPQRSRISARIIAEATGQSENEIHQAVSRARRKVKTKPR